MTMPWKLDGQKVVYETEEPHSQTMWPGTETEETMHTTTTTKTITM